MKTDERGEAYGTRVAVEVAGGWLKLAEVSVSRRGVRVERVLVEKSGDEEPTADSVRQFVRQAGVEGQPVVACVPRQAVTVRFIDLPSTSPREVADMIELQIGRQTPYSTEEIVYGYRILSTGREGYTRVMLVIAQRSAIRQRFHLLEEAGLRVHRMSVSSEGLVGWFRRAGAGADAAATLIVDVDAAYSEILVIAGGDVQYSRSILGGAAQVEADAERLVQEVERALAAWRGEEHAEVPARILLAGAGAQVPGLAAAIEAACRLPVEAAVYREAFVSGATLEALSAPAARGVSATAVLGAASGADGLQIDLTPEAVRERERLEDTARLLTRLGMRLMAILMLVAILVLVKLHQKREYLDGLQARTRETLQPVAEIERMQQQTALVKERLDRRNAPLNVLAEVQRLTPDSVYLTLVQTESDRVVTRGVAEGQSEVFAFVSALESSPLFVDAQSTRTARTRTGTEFEIACMIER